MLMAPAGRMGGNQTTERTESHHARPWGPCPLRAPAIARPFDGKLRGHMPEPGRIPTEQDGYPQAPRHLHGTSILPPSHRQFITEAPPVVSARRAVWCQIA